MWRPAGSTTLRWSRGPPTGFAPFSVRPAARWSSDVWSTPGPAARPMLSKPGACAEVGDASEPKELWTSISSVFFWASKPCQLSLQGWNSRDFLGGFPARLGEMRAEAYASHTFHKAEQQTVSPQFSPAAATATAKSPRRGLSQRKRQRWLWKKIKAELDEERRSYHETPCSANSQSPRRGLSQRSGRDGFGKDQGRIGWGTTVLPRNSLLSQTAKAQEEACRREAAEMGFGKRSRQNWMRNDGPTTNSLLSQQPKPKKRLVAEKWQRWLWKRSRQNWMRKRRSLPRNSLLSQQPKPKKRPVAEKRQRWLWKKIKAELDEERRSYHELWVRHEEQGGEIFVLKEESAAMESRAQGSQGIWIPSTPVNSMSGKQKAQLEQEEFTPPSSEQWGRPSAELRKRKQNKLSCWRRMVVCA